MLYFEGLFNGFNPRSRVGSDDGGMARVNGTKGFNPRSRVGSDFKRSYINLILLFQSTLPRGERLIGTSSLFADSQVSIHAPAWGATIPPSFIGCASLFQSTLPRGERHCLIFIGNDIDGFNPRSRVGSDDFIVSAVFQKYGFNPRSRVGSDSSFLTT